MAANLIGLAENDFSDDVIAKLASFLGETQAKAKTALSVAIPAIVGGLCQKAQTPQGAGDLAGVLQRGGFDGRSLGDIAQLVRSASRSSDLITTGSPLLFWLFGPRQKNVTDAIAATSGLAKQSSTSLLALAASYIASLVGREASASGGFNAASVSHLLGAQAPHLAAVAPSGLAPTWERV